MKLNLEVIAFLVYAILSITNHFVFVHSQDREKFRRLIYLNPEVPSHFLTYTKLGIICTFGYVINWILIAVGFGFTVLITPIYYGLCILALCLVLILSGWIVGLFRKPTRVGLITYLKGYCSSMVEAINDI